MLFNYQAFIAVIVGLIFAIFYVTKNKKHLMYLVCIAQLIIDERYVIKLYKSFSTQEFYSLAQHKYGLLTYNDHVNALELFKSNIEKYLKIEYKVIAKEMLYRYVRIMIVPLILSLLFGQPAIFIGTTLVCIVSFMLYEVFIVHNLSYLRTIQTTVIVRHAYSYFSRSSNIDPYPQTPTIDSFYDGNTQQKNLITLANIQENVHINSTSENGSSSYKLSNTQYGNIDKITLQHVWWGNDVVISLLIILVYWFNTAESFTDSLFGAAQIIIFIQLFFVPGWVLIRLTMKLLSKETY